MKTGGGIRSGDDADAAGEKLLHEAAFLSIEGGALLAEETEFGVGGVEDIGDGSLLGDFGCLDPQF